MSTRILTFPRVIVRGARETAGFEARVNGNPKLWSCGLTREEAIQDVIRTHYEHFAPGAPVYEHVELGKESAPAMWHEAKRDAYNLLGDTIRLTSRRSFI